MTFGSALSSLVWFGLILAAIPLALWLLKRSPVGGATASGPVRLVASLPLAPNQRLLTVEVGQGEARRWLLLGVSGQSITTLHEMAPQGDAAAPATPPVPFAQLMARLARKDGGDAR